MSFFPRWPVLLTLLSILLLAVRFTNLMNTPIFTDEAGYLHSSVLINQDFFTNWDVPMRRFFGPTGFLYMWITALFLNFTEDPLLAARLVSVFAGLGTGLGMFFLGRKLFTPTVGLLAMLLIAFSPIHVLSDRTAVMDSLLGTMYIWTLLFAVCLVLRPQWRWAILTGIFLGLSVWAKPTGRLFFTVVPFVIVLAAWKRWRTRGADENARHPKWIALLLGAALGIGFLFILFLNISPSSEYANERTRQLAQSTETILSQPWLPLVENGIAVIKMFNVYDAAPFFLFLPVVVVMLFLKNQTRLRMLALIFIVSIGEILLLGITFGSKYIYYATLPLFLMIGATTVYAPRALSVLHLPRIGQYGVTGILVAALLVPMVRQDFIFLFEPINDHFYLRDKTWATTGSGYGIPDIVARIKDEVGQETPTIILAEGISGHLWSTFSVYFADYPNVEVRRFERVLNFIPEGEDEEKKREYYTSILDENAKGWNGEQVYLVLHNDLAQPFADDRIELLYERKKPTTPEFAGNYWVRLFAVEYKNQFHR